VEEEPGKKECVVLITKGCTLTGDQDFEPTKRTLPLPHPVPFGICWQDEYFTGEAKGSYMTTRKVAEETARRQNRNQEGRIKYTVYAPLVVEE